MTTGVNGPPASTHMGGGGGGTGGLKSLMPVF